MAFPSIYPRFGASVGLSHSGKVLAFGAPIRKNNNLDTNTNFGANNEGAVFIYHLNSKTNLYEEVAGPLVPSTVYGSRVGQGVAVSGDGSVVCAGASIHAGLVAGNVWHVFLESNAWMASSTSRQQARPAGPRPPPRPATSTAPFTAGCITRSPTPTTSFPGCKSSRNSSPQEVSALPPFLIDSRHLHPPHTHPRPLVGPSQDGNEFGAKVSLSKSGEWLAVGAPELDTSTLLNAGAGMFGPF